MKKIIFILLSAATFASCKKNNGDTEPVNSATGERLKQKIDGGGTTTFTYDPSGRVVLKTYSGGGKSTFEYFAGKVIEKQYHPSGNLEETYTYDLNGNALVIKETRSSDAGFQELKEYNADGQQLKSTSTDNGLSNIDQYYYSNGNNDSIRYINQNGWAYTAKRTFYTDKPNVLDHDIKGESFFGHGSKNLLKTEQYFFSNGTVNPILKYSYEFDAKGRVVKLTEEYDGDSEFITYTYQ